MYDYNLTAQEISDYNADMLELRGEFFAPLTDEEMEEEYRRLMESRIRIAMSVAPLPQAVKDAVADELQSRGKQTGKC